MSVEERLRRAAAAFNASLARRVDVEARLRALAATEERNAAEGRRRSTWPLLRSLHARRALIAVAALVAIGVGSAAAMWVATGMSDEPNWLPVVLGNMVALLVLTGLATWGGLLLIGHHWRRALSLVLAAVLAIGVGVGIVSSVQDRVAARRSPPLTVVRGMIGSELQPFFLDPEVAAAFARHGLDVQVDAAGSREIARIDLDRYDFAFVANASTAEAIRRQHKATALYQPFSTLLAVATFKPIAELLRKAGLASPLADGYWRLDMNRYLDLVGKETRWNQLPGNTTYTPDTSVLIASTDPGTSNSAAMYLAIASYLYNDNRPLTSNRQVDQVLGKVAPLFLRQGFLEHSAEGPFMDYLTIGAGKAPMVMIYEAQYLAAAAAQDGSIGPDMVLMYPEPTVLATPTLVSLKPASDRIEQLLTSDPELQRLAVRWGFRTADAAVLRNYLADRKVAPPPNLGTIVEPPTYEILDRLITRLEKQYLGK